MEAFVSSRMIFHSAAFSHTFNRSPDLSLLISRSPVMLCNNRRDLDWRFRASSHENNAIEGHARSYAERFVLGVLRKTPKPTRWMLSLFNFSRRIFGSGEERDAILADHIDTVSISLSRQLNADLEFTHSGNEEAFLLSVDEKDAFGNVESELETAGGTEREQSQAAKFTAEKARLLRQELRSSEAWHDLMYHSAIASRLAAPDS